MGATVGRDGITCGVCGLKHGDGAALKKLGWQMGGEGSAIQLANCPCGNTLTLAELTDVSICAICRRLVLGSDGDIKIVSESHGVFCVGCARRSTHAILLPKPHRWIGARR